MAAGNVRTLMMSKVSVAEDPGEVKDNKNRRRVPMCPVECLITEDNGISFSSSSFSANDIIAYEICDDATHASLMSFSDEDAFVENLFNMTGDFQLIFIMEDYELIGDISL